MPFFIGRGIIKKRVAFGALSVIERDVVDKRKETECVLPFSAVRRRVRYKKVGTVSENKAGISTSADLCKGGFYYATKRENFLVETGVVFRFIGGEKYRPQACVYRNFGCA